MLLKGERLLLLSTPALVVTREKEERATRKQDGKRDRDGHRHIHLLA